VRERLAVTAVVVMVLVSACGTSSTVGTGTVEPSATPSAAPTLPPRPREIDLTGVDTCTLLTPQQQRKLGTDRPPVFTKDADRFGNRRCDYRRSLTSPRFGYQLKAVTQEDVAVYLTSERDTVARVVSAAGFPAVEARSPGDERGCFALVSTKHGQYLNVQYGESEGSNDTPEVACEKARVAAELAMQTLLTQR
jgi:uncharacterized protein DUF3558